jgi:hypothetical protein
MTVGARGYPISENEASWLASELEESGQPDAGRVAKAIRVTLEDRSTEPLELGQSQIGPVCDALGDAPYVGNARIASLYAALRRYEGDAGI